MSDIGTLQALQQSNQERLQKLAQDGIGFDPVSMLKLRVDLLTDQLMTPDQAKQFELTWERQVEEFIVQAEQQVTKAKLTAGLGGVQMSLADINNNKPLGG